MVAAMMLVNSLWHFIASSASVATIIGCTALAVAIFSGNIIVRFAIPDLRKWAIVVAVIAFSYTSIAGKFYNDGLSVKQAQWDASLVKETENGEKARDDAERTVAPVSSDRRMLRSDPFNRNSGTEPECK